MLGESGNPVHLKVFCRGIGALVNSSHSESAEKEKMEEKRKTDCLVKHTGGCHCGAIRFEVWNAADLHVFDCNCSICTKKQNRHFIVPKAHFTLLQGSENITTYTFNTHTAKHTFCKICGVQSFYTPRSNPDGFGVAPHCLDPGTIRSVTVEQFCGENWEESMQKHTTIRSMSMPEEESK